MLNNQQQREYDDLKEKISRVVEAHPEWSNIQIAKTLMVADPSIKQSESTIRQLVATVKGSFWKVNMDEVDEVKKLIC